jgi:hypothetical protein
MQTVLALSKQETASPHIGYEFRAPQQAVIRDGVNLDLN